MPGDDDSGSRKGVRSAGLAALLHSEPYDQPCRPFPRQRLQAAFTFKGKTGAVPRARIVMKGPKDPSAAATGAATATTGATSSMPKAATAAVTVASTAAAATAAPAVSTVTRQRGRSPNAPPLTQRTALITMMRQAPTMESIELTRAERVEIGKMVCIPGSTQRLPSDGVLTQTKK